MDINFANKVAAVIGGTKGIGLGCAELLASSGAKVAVAGVDNVKEATKIVEEKGVVKGYLLDVTDVSAINSTVERIRQDLGEIDILVCSAGISRNKPTADVTEADWDFMLSINAKGLFFCNQAVAVQSMIPRKTGAIVNFASTMGIVAAPYCLTYATSKGAVLQITRVEALEWAQYNIRVNAVAPTWVLTDLSKPLLSDPEFKAMQLNNIPLHRFATINEVASAVCFLASNEASMVTGIALPVDGGETTQ